MKNNDSKNAESSPQDADNKIKSAKVVNNSTITEPQHKDIKPAKILNEMVSTDIMAESVFEEEQLEYKPQTKVKTSRKRWFIFLTLAVIVASIVELVMFVIEITRNSDWLGAIWLGIFGVALIFFITMLLSELRGLQELRRQNELRETSDKITNSPTIGLAESHCLNLASRLPQSYQFLVTNWQDSLDDIHNDHEIMCLFEHNVLTPIDKIAIKQVTNNASAAGVMIAVSPFAMLDMFIVLWRNIRLMNQLSEIYGLHLGYWGRVKLIRNIFNNMVYAGAAEILSDAGNYALGAGITGKLSTRVAQGLGAGVLTSRIGIKAMEQCRPLSWSAENKPGIANISKQLLTELNSKIN
ncbi:TIGR01620 family protein [uncultured Paraglaciecola sp.]|uniref:YcjF family protein n=1 Tax=uncultured Paraglaciecola sp. TaxID=1765024 RepID=UPI002596D70B|nr:TIGR01620 family protein [uncultured Paraglaciecola sp.]